MDCFYQSAKKHAELIQSGSMSSEECVRSYFERIHKANPTLRIFVQLDEEGAIARAKEADRALAQGETWGPFHGVPFSIKDTYASKGIRTTFALPEHKNMVPDFNATILQRIFDAGGILLGKTSAPFGSFDWQCNHPLEGVCKNPWNPEMTPGGSSGGSAAAVAAGLSPLDFGSDIAGSIRVPSHYCGVYGFRSTEGAVSRFGHAPAPGELRVLREMCSFGPITRDIDDLELAFSLIYGSDGQENWLPPCDLKRKTKPLSECRFLLHKGFELAPLCQDTQTTLEEVKEFLLAQGADVEETNDFGFDEKEALLHWGYIAGTSMIAAFPAPARWAPFRYLFRLGLTRAWFGKSIFAKGFGIGLSGSLRLFYQALTLRDIFRQQFHEKLRGFDAMIAPVSSTSAFSHRTLASPILVDGNKVPYSNVNSFYNCSGAFTGSPGLAVPWTLSSNRLPIGIQLLGAHWSDFQLIDIAKQLPNSIRYELPQKNILSM